MLGSHTRLQKLRCLSLTRTCCLITPSSCRSIAKRDVCCGWALGVHFFGPRMSRSCQNHATDFELPKFIAVCSLRLKLSVSIYQAKQSSFMLRTFTSEFLVWSVTLPSNLPISNFPDTSPGFFRESEPGKFLQQATKAKSFYSNNKEF